MKGARGASLLLGRRRIPNWPLHRWHSAVGDVLEYFVPTKSLDTYCVALNNAALIEVLLGRPEEARVLCLSQIDLLSKISGDLKVAASHYIWQPIVNTLRLDAVAQPKRARILFTSLNDLVMRGDRTQLPNDLAAGITRALESSHHKGILTWIHSLTFTETVNSFLKAEDRSSLADLINSLEKSQAFVEGMSVNEAALLLSFWEDGVKPLEALCSSNSIPYVVSLCHICRWFTLAEVQEISRIDVRSLIFTVLDAILSDKQLAYEFYTIVGDLALFAMGPGTQRDLESVELDFLRRALLLFEEIQDEVWQYRISLLVRNSIDVAEKIRVLEDSSLYSHVALRESIIRRRPPPLLERLSLNPDIETAYNAA